MKAIGKLGDVLVFMHRNTDTKNTKGAALAFTFFPRREDVVIFGEMCFILSLHWPNLEHLPCVFHLWYSCDF